MFPSARTYVLGAMLGGFLTGSALAQGETPAPGNPSPPPGGNPSTSQPAQASAPTGAPTFLTQQPVDQMGLAKAMGEDVYNAQNEKIGEVKDFIFDGSGMIRAAVIGVGGFLGVGEKNVAVDFRSLKVTRDPGGKTRATLDTTRDALRAAPEYKYAGN